MCSTTTEGVHPFEKAGLGKAPFRFAGMSESVYVIPGVGARAGSSCDYCSTAIRDVCHIRSADGKTFKVGTDCVMKLERLDNRLVSDVEKARKKLAAAKNKKRKAAEAERIKAAFARLDDVFEAFSAKPHPSENAAKGGLTLFDYVLWIQAHAGHAGRLKVAKMIEKELA